nr:TauD/TfdA family dioxygenase [Mastigocoleus sp. MO_167.B18]
FELWQKIIITYKIKKTAHYGGEVTEPLINKHPLTGNTILRFAEPLNEETKNPYPLFLEISGLPPEKHEQFLSRIIKKLYLPQNFFAHEWEQGDFLIADNNALLHGRNPFPAESGRHLQRVQVI